MPGSFEIIYSQQMSSLALLAAEVVHAINKNPVSFIDSKIVDFNPSVLDLSNVIKNNPHYSYAFAP